MDDKKRLEPYLIRQQDENGEFDNDLTDVASLSSSVLEYEYENGRRYHSNSIVGSL